MAQRFKQARNRTVFARLLLPLIIVAMNVDLVYSAGSSPQENIASRPKQLQTIITFIREEENKIGSYTATSQTFLRGNLQNVGYFYYKSPHLIRWEECDPYEHRLQNLLIIDNQRYSLYFPSSKELHLKRWDWRAIKLADIAPFVGAVVPGETVELVGIQTIGKEPTYVLEMSGPVIGNPTAQRMVRGYFSQRTGLLVRIADFDERKEVLHDTVFQDFKPGAPLGDETFKFVPSPDVKMIDETQ